MSAPATSSATASNTSSARRDRSATSTKSSEIVHRIAQWRPGAGVATSPRSGKARTCVPAPRRSNGQEVVLGTAMLLIGENSRTVAQRVAAKLKEIGRSLPEGVIAHTVYDRTHLVEATIATVRTISSKAPSW